MLPPCGHENPAQARFCLECGAALALGCAGCHAELPASAKFCLACGLPVGQGTTSPPPSSGAEIERPGERRQLTILFCDLVGSTELSARLDAEDLREVVRAYQGAAAGAVERFGGHVAQYLGDGILAYFGYPQAHDDDAERALRAGLAAVDGVGALRERLGRSLAVRVGVHTGPVVVGEMGAGARRETLALGETTNVAARLEAAAAPDTVVASDATLRLARGIFVTEDLGALTLRGVPAPVPAHRVVQPSGVRSRLDVAAGRLTRFVGREVELATLVERWERAADGEGQNVLIVGEAGVGKSRLAYQLRERLATVPHTWLECSASPYTEGTPFHPVIALVAQGLAVPSTDTTAEKVEKIERGLRDLATPENVALLADFLGLRLPTPLALNPDVQRRKTMELLAQWTLAISAIQPLVLLVEDVHWCDASSLELLGRIIAQSATARVLFVATARPEFTPPWPARSNLTTLQLARLTKRQARQMVTTLLGETVPTETLEALVKRADGVPLYVEELTKAVAEPGAARSAEAIPTTLAGSLMARLDRLSTAKEVAQRAAILGREFSYPLLAAVAGMDDGALCAGLDRLVQAEIVFARGEPPNAAYTFKHALVQEAAYESLLKRTRQALHEQVVQTLLCLFPERAEAEPEVVAAHAEAAGRIDEAVTHSERAGTQAQGRSAHAEAIAHFRRGVRLLGTLAAGPERDVLEGGLQLALGASSVAVRGYGHPETGAAYERARELFEAAGDQKRLAVALTGCSIASYTRGEMQRGITFAEQALTIAERLDDDSLRLPALVQIALPEHFQGKFTTSLARCEKALALYDASRHGSVAFLVGTDQGAVARGFSAWNLWHLGYPDRALERAREALEQSTTHPFSQCHSLIVETVLHWLRRDMPSLSRAVDEVVGLSEAMGFPFWLGWGRAYRGALLAAGAVGTAALTEASEGLALAATTGQVCAPMLLACVAGVQQATGLHAEALETIESALAVSDQTDQHFFDAELYRLRGEFLLATGGPADEAAARYHRALAIAREQGARSFELRAATSLARLWRDQGKRTEARHLLAPVYASFTEGFDTSDLIDAKALLNELA